jgi:RND family efflux transporter MFP subunit
VNKRILIISFIVVAALAVAAYIVLPLFSGTTASTAGSAQTAQVERGTLVASVSAAGTVASPQSATLSWETAGIVGAINVEVGQVVQAGEVLMELDADSLSAAVFQAQADLLAAQEALAVAEAGPTAQAIAQAQVAVVEAQAALTSAEKNLQSVSNPNVAYYQQALADAQTALEQAQAQSTITDIGDGLATSLNNAKKAVDSAYEALGRVQSAEAGCGGCDPARLARAQEVYDSAVNHLTAIQLQMDMARQGDAVAIREAQEALTTAQANLAAAQAGPDSADVTKAQAQLDLANANLAAAQDTLAELQAGPDTQAIAAAKAKLAAAEEAVNVTQLVAPFSGTVIRLSNRVGDSVTNNETAIVLADLSTLELQVSVSEVDVNSVVVGQKVTLTADAAPSMTFEGTVAAVTTVGTSSQGVVTFPVTVIIPNPDPALKPGMSAAVSIITEERADVLLVPNRAIRVSNGQRSVTVMFEGQQFSVPVTLGLSNDSYTEVVEGSLKEGDTVVTRSSTTTTTQNSGGGLFGFLGGGPAVVRP